MKSPDLVSGKKRIKIETFQDILSKQYGNKTRCEKTQTKNQDESVILLLSSIFLPCISFSKYLLTVVKNSQLQAPCQALEEDEKGGHDLALQCLQNNRED